MLFNKCCEEWLEEQFYFVKQSTYRYYEFLITRHLLNGFKDLEEIDSISLNTFITQKSINGRIDSKGGLAGSTINQLIILIKMICKRYGHVVPKTNKISSSLKANKYEIFNQNEFNKIKSYLVAHPNNINCGILIAMHSGIRIGELSALKYEDISDGQINITKTLQRIYSVTEKTKVIISTPKSRNSTRKIPLHSQIDIGKKEGYIMTGGEKYLEPRLINYHFKNILRKLEIVIRPFHYLRHTFATRLIESTGDFKTVSTLLGHSSVATTLDIYSHSNSTRKKSCIESL